MANENKMIPMRRICFLFLISSIVINLTDADRWNQNRHNNNSRNNHNNSDNDRHNQRENNFKPSDNRNQNQNVKRGLAEDMKHPLSKDDFDKAKQLDQRFFAIDDKVLYSSKLFEGDIADDLFANATTEKNAIRSTGSHWPDGRVPYVISTDFNGEERSVIARAIDEYHSKTCVRFEPYSGSEPNYIHLVRGSGCSSRVGMAGGQQQVTLGQGCVTVGIVEHELMHALGFVHEQSRTDRDRYIRVNYQNIRRGLEPNFRKYSVEEITSLNEPYDYGSVLHYGSTAFSNGNGPTIEPLERGSDIGQRVGFSEIDLAKINKLYRCNGRPGLNQRPESSDRYRPEEGHFGNRPGSSSFNRPDRERPGFGSLTRPDSRPDSSYRPGNGFVTSTYRPSIIDNIFGGFSSTHRPSSGYRPTGSSRPDIDGGEFRPGHGFTNGHHKITSRPTDINGPNGFRPSTIDPDSESYQIGSGGGGSGSRFSTHRPSGFGYSTTYRPNKETEEEYNIRPSYTSTYRPYGQSRPDYGNGFGSHRPGSSSYETASTFRPFGGNNGFGNIGNGISSIFGGGRLPGSSVIESIRPSGNNNNNGNRGSSLISSFLRPNRRPNIPSLIGSFLGQDDPNNPTTTQSTFN